MKLSNGQKLGLGLFALIGIGVLASKSSNTNQKALKPNSPQMPQGDASKDDDDYQTYFLIPNSFKARNSKTLLEKTFQKPTTFVKKNGYAGAILNNESALKVYPVSFPNDEYIIPVKYLQKV